MISVGEVYNAVASAGAKTLPSSERQLRPLLSLRKPNEPSDVWGKRVAETWAKADHEAAITRKRITGKSVERAMQQLGFAPPATEKLSGFDLEARWTRLQAQLEHEKEYWPVEHRPELRVRITGLITDWPDAKSEPSESEVPTPRKPTATVLEQDLHGKRAQGEVRITAEAPLPNRKHQPRAEDDTGSINESKIGDENDLHGSLVANGPTDAQTGETQIARPELQRVGERASRFAHWNRLNWRLTNRDLAAVWQLKPKTVDMMRFRKKHGRAQSCNAEGIGRSWKLKG
jgi:hypothetical protein